MAWACGYDCEIVFEVFFLVCAGELFTSLSCVSTS